MGSDCYERQLVTMSDGGTVGLDWFADSNEEDRWSPSTPIVLVMHGLTGLTQHHTEATLRVPIQVAVMKGTVDGCATQHTSTNGDPSFSTTVAAMACL